MKTVAQLIIAIISLGSLPMVNAQSSSRNEWQIGAEYNHSIDEKHKNYQIGVTGAYKFSVKDKGYYLLPEGALYYQRYDHMIFPVGGPRGDGEDSNIIGLRFSFFGGKQFLKMFDIATGPSLNWNIINNSSKHAPDLKKVVLLWRVRGGVRLFGHFKIYVDLSASLNRPGEYMEKRCVYLGGGVQYCF